MKLALAASLLLVAAAGCKTDPTAGPREAWQDLHTAVSGHDWKAALRLVSRSTREQKIEFAANIRAIHKKLSPGVKAQNPPWEAGGWTPERHAAELLLLELDLAWRVRESEAPVIESVTGDAAVVVVSAPGKTVRWALVREEGEWKFDLEASKSAPRVAGEGPATPVECRARLKELGVAMALYESKYKAYPAGWADMKRTGDIAGDTLEKCPCGASPVFQYCRRPPTDALPPDTFVGWDAVAHADGTRNVLTFQGKVETLKDAEFQQRLKSQYPR